MQHDARIIQIPFKIQDPAFRSHLMPSHCGPGTNIGHRHIAFAVKLAGAGVNAQLWHYHALRNPHIGRRHADGASQLPSLYHIAAQTVGMPQKFGRRFHIPRFNQLADMGGRNTDALQRLLRHDHAGQIPLPAKRRQLLSIAFAMATKPEIVAANKTHSAHVHQLHQKIPPRS